MKLFEKFRKKKELFNRRVQGLYGPPEMLERRRRQMEREDIQPENNVAEDVYGPPEMFGRLNGEEEEDIEE